MQLGSLIYLVTTHAKIRSVMFFTIAAIKRYPGISSDHQHITMMVRITEEKSQKRVDHLLKFTWQQKSI